MTKATWVFVAGTYRTASTTQYLIARDIVNASGSGRGVGYYTCDKIRKFDKTFTYIACKAFEPLWERECVSHLFSANRVKVLVTIRDPRDIATSIRVRRDGIMEAQEPTSWFEEMATVRLPKWLGNLEKWVDLGNVVMVSRYEVMTVYLRGEVDNVCKHLGIELDCRTKQAIADRYTKTAMTERRELAIQTGKRQDEWLQAIPPIIFGSSGAYKSCLSDEERTLVEDASSKFMHRFGYTK